MIRLKSAVMLMLTLNGMCRLEHIDLDVLMFFQFQKGAQDS